MAWSAVLHGCIGTEDLYSESCGETRAKGLDYWHVELFGRILVIPLGETGPHADRGGTVEVPVSKVVLSPKYGKNA
jgi:hypothetical protein